ncbi:hypothetical protein PAECIP111891_03129 [Paenibacillus allorhizoplanae]|jgi:hypothetical protein|uniref:DUF2304 domain-containing protein n=1 Tax=Paenibacillus allorhizoplanae TaxID=2905648 RepID=A0ABN8GHX2_9BACL|nr:MULTISPECIES: DUF2304 domain-containing protein [Paenibacillus]KRE75501.1 hypothetical protein ASL11_01310 [Paenibacillus sp. Soil750]CAH1207947.1 hypothetical protein PAECIP111891_03129 [Paenibacillus allorhizoplanae]
MLTSEHHLYSVQLMGVVFSLILMSTVFMMVRARRLREKYALVWFVIGIFTLIMSMFTNLMEWFSKLLGIDYAPSAFFAILIASAYLLLLNTSISISGLKLHNKALTQELGLTKLRLEELEKKSNEEEKSSNISC